MAQLVEHLHSIAVYCGFESRLRQFYFFFRKKEPSSNAVASCCLVSTIEFTCTCTCTRAGPVLNETLFLPQSAQEDITAMFVNWALHPGSRPAARFIITHGLLKEEGRDVTQTPVNVLDPLSPPNRHQISPVDPEEVYLVTIRALDGSGNVSPEISAVWSALEETRERREGG